MTTKYVVHLMSESCDHYYVKIPAGEKWPKRDQKAQLALVIKYGGPGVDDGSADGDGPGIGGSYLHVQAVIEV